MAEVFVDNSYINEKTCGIPSNTRKRKISHILKTAPTHDSEYIKKGFAQKNISTNNKSAVGQIVKSACKRVAHVAWERSCAKIITLCVFWRKLQAII